MPSLSRLRLRFAFVAVVVLSACASKSSSSSPAPVDPCASQRDPSGIYCLASSGMELQGIAVDATNVYFEADPFGSSSTLTGIAKVPIAGGDPVNLAPQQQFQGYYPFTIAVDATNVYWGTFGVDATNGGTGPGITGNVMKVPIVGGSTAVVAPAPGTEGISGIAIDSASVYWGSDRLGSIVMKTPIGGGASSGIFPGRVQAIAVDATSVYWTSRVEGTLTMAPKSPVAGDSTTTLASGLGFPFGIALDESNVYFTENQSGDVKKIPKAGGPATTLASGQQNCTGIAVDGTDVYFTTSTGVMRVPIVGGSVTTVAAGYSGPGIAVDSTNVYWTNGLTPAGLGSGFVMKAGKR